MSPTVSDVLSALRSVADPCAIATGVPIDVVAMGLVQDLRVGSGHVAVELRLTSPFCMQIGLIRDQIEKAVGHLEGVEHVDVGVDHTAEWMPEHMELGARDALRRVRPLALTVIP